MIKAVTMESSSSNNSSEIELQESFDSEESIIKLSDADNVDMVPSGANDLQGDNYIRKKQPFKHFVGKLILKYEEGQRNDSLLKCKPTETFVFPDIC